MPELDSEVEIGDCAVQRKQRADRACWEPAMSNALTPCPSAVVLTLAASQELPHTPVGVLLSVGGMVAFLVLIYLFRLTMSRWNVGQQRVMQHQADKRGGDLVDGSLIGGQSLRFPITGGAEAKVYQADSGKGRGHTGFKTCFEAAVSTTARLWVYPEVRVLGVGIAFGQDFQVGNAEFDGSFVVQGTSEPAVRQFLTDEVCECLLCYSPKDTTLKVKNGTMTLTVWRPLFTAEETDEFLDVGLKIAATHG